MHWRYLHVNKFQQAIRKFVVYFSSSLSSSIFPCTLYKRTVTSPVHGARCSVHEFTLLYIGKWCVYVCASVPERTFMSSLGQCKNLRNRMLWVLVARALRGDDDVDGLGIALFLFTLFTVVFFCVFILHFLVNYPHENSLSVAAIVAYGEWNMSTWKMPRLLILCMQQTRSTVVAATSSTLQRRRQRRRHSVAKRM